MWWVLSGALEASGSDFFFNDTATTEIYTLSLHDALPICVRHAEPGGVRGDVPAPRGAARPVPREDPRALPRARDRKSTRLNSSHANISYAVFCLKKKNTGSTVSRSKWGRSSIGTQSGGSA